MLTLFSEVPLYLISFLYQLYYYKNLVAQYGCLHTSGSALEVNIKAYY